MSKIILVVDDLGIMILSLKNNFEIFGFKVIIVNDGVVVLVCLGQMFKLDFIIIDINMFNMGGIEFIGKVCVLLGFCFMFILVFSIESQQVKCDEVCSVGVSGWMVKLVLGVELFKIVKQVLLGV